MNGTDKISLGETGEKLLGRHHRDGAGFEVSRVPGEDDFGAAGEGGCELQGVFEIPHAELESGEGIVLSGFGDFDPGGEVGYKIERNERRFRSGACDVVRVRDRVPCNPALVIPFAAEQNALVAGFRTRLPKKRVEQNVGIEEDFHRLFHVLLNEIGKARISIEFFLIGNPERAAPLSHKTLGGILRNLRHFLGVVYLFRLRHGHLQSPITHFYDKFGSFLNGESGHTVEGKAKGDRTHLDGSLLSSPAPGNS